MLKLRKRKPAAIPVALGGGSVIRVRPATQIEVETATAQTARDIAGLIDGAEVAGRLAPLLGEDFGVEALADAAKLSAASQKLARIRLVMECQSGWDDVALEDGTMLAAPEAWSVALLLDDPRICSAVMEVINARVHSEIIEGNGLPALPSGGAGIPGGAPDVAKAAKLALRADGSGTVN